MGGGGGKTTSYLEFVGGFVESTEVCTSAYFCFDCVGILNLNVSIKRTSNIGLYHSNMG